MKQLRAHRTAIHYLMIALMAFWQIAQPLQAATFYWDADANATDNNIEGTNLGGTGIWDTLTANWWDLTNDVAWPNLAADRALFTYAYPTTAGLVGVPTSLTVTVSNGINANQLSFLRSGYTLTGGDITLGGTTPGLHANLGESVTISSQIFGTNGLVKTGGGSIRLTGANTYSGITTIANGSLVINGQGALGTGTSAISILTSNNTPSNLNQIGFTGGSLVLDGASAGFTFSRDINLEGRGPIGDRGAALNSIGDNSLSGTITTAVSPLVPATFRNSRINSINGTLNLSGTVVSQGTSATTFLSLGGVNSAGVGNFDLSGVLTGSGSIEKSGAGTLFLNPSSNAGYTGTLRISASATGQQSSVRVTQASIGGTSVFGANTGTTTSAAIDLNGGVLEFRSDGNLDFGVLPTGKNIYTRSTGIIFTASAAGGAGINGITTLGALHQNASGTAGTNTTTFNSRNGYGVTLTTLASDASTSSTSITTTLANNLGGVLRFTGNLTMSEGSTASRPRVLAFGGNGNTFIQGSIIAGTDVGKTMTKSGTGSLTIQGTGTTVAGAISINGGAIIATDFRSLNNNSATINIGSTTTAGALIIGGTGTAATAAGLTTSKVINLAGTTGAASIYANQAGNNPIILNASFTATGAGAKTLTLGGSNAADNVINGAIVNNSGTNTTALTKIGSGTWVLAGANSYTGATTLSNGTLKIRANAATSTVLSASNAITFNATSVFAGATLEFVGQNSVNNTQSLGALTTTQGANTIRLTPGSGGTASLVFASLGTIGDGSTVNIVGSNGTTNTVTLTGVATGLVSPHFYFGGSNFAYSESGLLRAPVYGADVGFVDAPAAAILPTGQNHVSVSGSITAQGTQTINTLKFNGGHTLTLASGATLTTRNGGANTDGGILATGGVSVITGGTGVTTGGSGALIIRVDGITDSLTLNTVLTSGTTGGLTKSGVGTLILSQNNALTGTVSLNEGTIRLSGTGDLGGGNALTIRQGAIFDLNGVTPASNVNAFNNNGVVTSSVAATLTVGGSNGTGESRGIVEGAINLTKIGTGAQSWLADSTYTGVTTIGSTGLVTVDSLANIGQNSGIGRGDATSDATNAASLVFNGSTGGLVYQGNIVNGVLNLGSQSMSTNRLFTLAGTGASLSSTASNNNAIIWSNTGAIVHAVVGPQTLILTGTSTGDNTFNPQLTDSGTGANITSVNKTGAGQWNLGNANNTYTGATTVGNGILAINHGGALPSSSALVLGATTTSGILQMSGSLQRDLATSAAPGVGTITWGGTTGGGGFAAHATALTVTLNGGAGLTWGSGGFVGTGGTQALILNSTTALAEVVFTNAINFGAALRTTTVNDNGNTGADYATLSGVLSGAGGGLLKNGAGVLRILGANTYTGTTEVQGGTLVVSSLGSSIGGGASSVGAGGVAMDNSNAIVLGNATTTGGILQYVGSGEVSDRKIRLRGTTAGNQIHADGSGALILTNVANDAATETGNKTLSLRGSNTSGNMITSQLSDNGAGVLSIGVDGGATWILTNGSNNYTGTTTVSAGALGIGHNTAIGAALTISNGNVFAYGGDRVITNTLNMGNNATSGFIGDYSITFNGTNNLAAGANNLNTYNSIVAGKALVLNGLLANALTATRAWALDGSGDTVINGDFTTTTGFGVNITKSGNGTLTLGTNGAASNWNQAGNNIDIDRGMLRFTADNAIPTAFGAAATTTSATVPVSTTTYTVASTAGLVVGQTFTGTNVPAGSRIQSIDGPTTFTATIAPTTAVASGEALAFAASGGLVISPEVADGDTATVDLNGTTQTVNGLTSTSNGTVVIDNTSATAASFRFGANNSTVNFGSGLGTYTIQNTGDGALDIIKLGSTTATFGSAVTLGNKGVIASEGGGVFNITGVVSAASALRAIGGSTLALTGGITNPDLITSIEVGGGSTLSLLDGLGSQISNLTTLNLGNTGTGTVTLNLNVGDINVVDNLGDGLATDTLRLLTTGGLNLGNTITFNLTDAGLNEGQTYTLLHLVDGGIDAFGVGKMLQGATPGGFDGFTWFVDNNFVKITTGNLIIGDLYWRGGTDTTWNANANNWSLNKDGTGLPSSIPGQGTKVIFAYDGVGVGALTTTAGAELQDQLTGLRGRCHHAGFCHHQSRSQRGRAP